MEAANIIKEIIKLPIIERMLIIENAMKSIREETAKERSLKEGAKALLSDYQTDKELTVFTSIDGEDFYEAK
ncbi:MAG: hypothetical protein PVH61_39295 [Candidatus Aminicenantes bacterium]|jgi:hypothetical protein